MINVTTDYLKFANVQMAAEALYGLQSAGPKQTFTGLIETRHLVFGNRHSSKFTDVQAKESVQDWSVVEHLSNTSTGFGGTLFRCLRTDAWRGFTEGEMALSFRSTELSLADPGASGDRVGAAVGVDRGRFGTFIPIGEAAANGRNARSVT